MDLELFFTVVAGVFTGLLIVEIAKIVGSMLRSTYYWLKGLHDSAEEDRLTRREAQLKGALERCQRTRACRTARKTK